MKIIKFMVYGILAFILFWLGLGVSVMGGVMVIPGTTMLIGSIVIAMKGLKELF